MSEFWTHPFTVVALAIAFLGAAVGIPIARLERRQRMSRARPIEAVPAPQTDRK